MGAGQKFKSSSIYSRLGGRMMIALIAAAAFFYVIQIIGNMAVGAYFSRTNYVQRENNRRIEQL